MIIVRIIGGLGNQMFQYAFYKNLKEKYGNVKCDIQGFENYKLHTGFDLEKHFDIKIEKATIEEIELATNFYNRNIVVRLSRKVFGYKKSHIEEKDFYWDLLNPKHNLYLDGYWQSDIFFGNQEDLKKIFKFINNFDNSTELKNRIESSNSVSLHVRRGDYVGNKYYAQLGAEYYSRAMELINSQIEKPVFYVFSDDLDWAENNLLTSLKSKFSIIFFKNETISAIQDLQMMASCKHNIIANSSFSWWGAWLNNNDNKTVIYPEKWYTSSDINKTHIAQMPDAWVAI